MPGSGAGAPTRIRPTAPTRSSKRFRPPSCVTCSPDRADDSPADGLRGPSRALFTGFRPGTQGLVALHLYGCIGRPAGAGRRRPWPPFFLGVMRQAATMRATGTQLEAVRTPVRPAGVALRLAVSRLDLPGGAAA